jgi:hypothetical protein
MLTRRFYKNYIKGTPEKYPVTQERDFLCKIGIRTNSILNQQTPCLGRDVFLNTNSLKHIHDRHVYIKKVPDDFILIMDELAGILKHPDFIYRDLPEKRAHFLLVRSVKVRGSTKRLLLCGIELIGDDGEEIEVVSAFITGEAYLASKFTLLWKK